MLSLFSIYRARQKRNLLEKFDISGIVADIFTKFTGLQMRIQSTYPANFVEITHVVQKRQQFILLLFLNAPQSYHSSLSMSQ